MDGGIGIYAGGQDFQMKLDLEPILVRIALGEPFAMIAFDVGMSEDGLRRKLRRESPERYRMALDLAELESIMRADDALQNARSPMELVAASRLGKVMRHRCRIRRIRTPSFTVFLKK